MVNRQGLELMMLEDLELAQACWEEIMRQAEQVRPLPAPVVIASYFELVRRQYYTLQRSKEAS